MVGLAVDVVRGKTFKDSEGNVICGDDLMTRCFSKTVKADVPMVGLPTKLVNYIHWLLSIGARTRALSG